MACAIMHNMLLKQSNTDVERLLNVLKIEGFCEDMKEETIVVVEVL